MVVDGSCGCIVNVGGDVVISLGVPVDPDPVDDVAECGDCCSY